MKNTLELFGRETVIVIKGIQFNEQMAHLLGEWSSGMRERIVICVTNDTNVKVSGNIVVLEGAEQ